MSDLRYRGRISDVGLMLLPMTRSELWKHERLAPSGKISGSWSCVWTVSSRWKRCTVLLSETVHLQKQHSSSIQASYQDLSVAGSLTFLSAICRDHTSHWNPQGFRAWIAERRVRPLSSREGMSIAFALSTVTEWAIWSLVRSPAVGVAADFGRTYCRTWRIKWSARMYFSSRDPDRNEPCLSLCVNSGASKSSNSGRCALPLLHKFTILADCGS